MLLTEVTKIVIAPSNQRNKSKIRISKSETNSEPNKSQIGKIQNTESEGSLEFYLFWSFDIVSNFGFRASNFFVLGAFASLRETQFFRSSLYPKISNIFG